MEELLVSFATQFPIAGAILIVVFIAFSRLKDYQDKNADDIKQILGDTREERKEWRAHNERREEILNTTLTEIVRKGNQ